MHYLTFGCFQLFSKASKNRIEMIKAFTYVYAWGIIFPCHLLAGRQADMLIETSANRQAGKEPGMQADMIATRKSDSSFSYHPTFENGKKYHKLSDQDLHSIQ